MEIKKIINNLLSKFNLEISRYQQNKIKIHSDEYDSLLQCRQDFEIIKFIKNIDFTKLLNLLEKSKSQLRQDLFALNHLNFKTNGFFVEFGATNGIKLSNTFLLEKEFNWKGILAEPARCWQTELKNNRNCFIETDCVWSNSNSKLVFNETIDPELSTIESYSSRDLHSESRLKNSKYEVKTISLLDLLIKHNAPKVIDYLSIDTEGSEYKILSCFDFSEYSFNVITVEHNYTSDRNLIFELLTENGYERVSMELSKFDDWYVKR